MEPVEERQDNENRERWHHSVGRSLVVELLFMWVCVIEVGAQIKAAVYGLWVNEWMEGWKRKWIGLLSEAWFVVVRNLNLVCGWCCHKKRKKQPFTTVFKIWMVGANKRGWLISERVQGFSFFYLFGNETEHSLFKKWLISYTWIIQLL